MRRLAYRSLSEVLPLVARSLPGSLRGEAATAPLRACGCATRQPVDGVRPKLTR